MRHIIGYIRKYCTYGSAFALVRVDDGLGVLVEGGEPLLDGLLVVVGAAWEAIQ